MRLSTKSAFGSTAAAVAVAALLSLMAVEAGALTISATDRGWVWEQASTYGDNGASPTNNYFIGQASAADREYRNWFTFDLSGVTDPIVSAVFRVHVAAYPVGDPSETFRIYQVTTPAGDLGSVANAAVWGDLGSGPVYGEQVLTPGMANSIIDIALSPAAVADLNAAAGGTFAMGGAMTTPFGFLFSGSAGSQYVTELVLTVPEPGTAALLAMGLLGLALRRRA